MRIVQLQRSASTPFGYRTVLVTWDDGTSTSEPVPPTVEDARVRQWLESRRGRGVQTWRRA